MQITDEQLHAIAETCEKISTKGHEMQRYAEIAVDGHLDSIELTDTQIQGLIALYLAGKTELVELYNQLP